MLHRHVVEVVFPLCPLGDQERRDVALLEFGGVSLESWLSAVDEALDSLGGRPAVIVGQSRGGLLALMYAAWGAKKSQVSGVILDDPFLAWADSFTTLQSAVLHLPILCYPAWTWRGFDPQVAIDAPTSTPSLSQREVATWGNPSPIAVNSRLYAGQVVDVSCLVDRLCRARVCLPVTAFLAIGQPSIDDDVQEQNLKSIGRGRLDLVYVRNSPMHLTLCSPTLWTRLEADFSRSLERADAVCMSDPTASMDVPAAYSASIDCSLRALLGGVPRGLRTLWVRARFCSGGRAKPGSALQISTTTFMEGRDVTLRRGHRAFREGEEAEAAGAHGGGRVQ
jgi:pimeloyl-ACP methyl ester carboxylesterase